MNTKLRSKLKPAPILNDRTRFGEIVAEFWQPRKPSTKAIILCDGCPTVPNKRRLGEFLAKKGYWVFHIRYRGTWESEGNFLEYSPHEDVLHVATRLNLGFDSLYGNLHFLLDIKKVFVIGTSFGGAAAVLSSLNPIIERVVGICPMLDWEYVNTHSKVEKFPDFLRMINVGFPGAYRGSRAAFKKLERGDFYNPAKYIKQFDRKKIFIVHAKDDEVIPVSVAKHFAKETGVKPIYLPKGGHISATTIMNRELWKKVHIFLKGDS